MFENINVNVTLFSYNTYRIEVSKESVALEMPLYDKYMEPTKLRKNLLQSH
jgi:hypothetical protein